MNFVALDVETANADMASICQVGVARFEDGGLVEEWKTYVDPCDCFDAVNVSVHGINEEMVKGAPKLIEIAPLLCEYIAGRVTVCHTHFDRVSIQRAFFVTVQSLDYPSSLGGVSPWRCALIACSR